MDLAPIPFTLVPLIPVGETLELPGALGWAMWDAAVRALDQEQEQQP